LKPEEFGFEVEYTSQGTKRTKVEILESRDGQTPAKPIIPGKIRTLIARKIVDKSVAASDVGATFGLGATTPYHWAETLAKKDPVELTSSRGGRPPMFDGTTNASFTGVGADLSRDPLLLHYANETRVRMNT
jgi:hypothetical protein